MLRVARALAGSRRIQTLARAARITTGAASTELDPAGTLRHYRRAIRTAIGATPTFPTALYDASLGAPGREESDESLRFINFHRRPSAGFVLHAAQLLDYQRSSAFLDSTLRGKIVLLGGTYAAGRDAHHTPVGMLPGVEIQAQALQTELAGGGAGVPSWLLLYSLQLVFGAGVVLLTLRLSPRRAALALLLLVIGGSEVGSLILTRSPVAGLIYFVPFFVLLVVHQLYEKANFYRELLLGEVYRYARGRPVNEKSIESIIELANERLSSDAQTAVRWTRAIQQQVGSLMSRRSRLTANVAPGEPATPPTDQTKATENRQSAD